MRLLEIEVRHWRGLSRKLPGLSPRLNLILGPNESGKSRLFQAIRFALFESYKGAAQHKQLLQSWISAEAPFVRMVFSEDNVEYELQKQFLKGAMAQISGGGTISRGDDAEESLRRITGARPVGNRGAGTADLGIWPLLMVSQGDSRSAVQEHLNEHGHGRLQERLSKEIGVASISAAGQRLMTLAEQEYGRYFTATGQETRVLREARTELAEADSTSAAASEALQRQEQTAAALAQNRSELSDLDTRVQSARRDSETARSKAEAAQIAGSRVALAQGNLSTVTLQLASVEGTLNTRIEADTVAERMTADIASSESELDRRVQVRQELENAVRTAERRSEDAERTVRDSRAAVEDAQRQRRRGELETTDKELSARIANLERLDASVAAERLRRAALPMIDDAYMGRLKKMDQTSRAAAAQLKGAAVSVVVHLRQPAAVDGMAHEAGEHVQIDVTENRHISIGEMADVEIRPGGGELDRLRESRAAADSALSAALRAVGASDLDHATAIHEDLKICDRRIGELGLEAKATSPKPLAQLQEDLARLKADIERLGPVSQINVDETSMSMELENAEDLLTQARGTRDGANAALSEFRSGTAGLIAKAATTREERDRLVHSYASRPTAETLRATREEVTAERERAQTELAVAEREFIELGGADVQVDARRLTQAADVLANRMRDVRSTGDKLQGVLQVMMEAGNYETLQQAAARAQEARTNLARFERQAAAARRLWEVLNEERRRVVERLIAPVTLRVKPYLQDFFPGSTLDAGEGLEIIGLQSGDLKEPFGELSGGAQEQISLLTRIGIAEVLAGDGTLPLILDDALINTDPERIKRVHRALFRAADKLQVILFSCHDVLFDGLGAEFVMKLEKCRYGVRTS
jgi:DNA repair exonuclease SbcCD ATPase subunit